MSNPIISRSENAPELVAKEPQHLIYVESSSGVPFLLCPVTHWGQDETFYNARRRVIESFMEQHVQAKIYTEGIISDALYDSTNVNDDTLEAAMKLLSDRVQCRSSADQDRHLDSQLSILYPGALVETDVTFNVFIDDVHRLIEEVSLENNISSEFFLREFSEYLRIRADLDDTVAGRVAERFGIEMRRLFKGILRESMLTLRNENLLNVVLNSTVPGVVIYGEMHFEDVLPRLFENGYFQRSEYAFAPKLTKSGRGE